ncbi:UNVERIFIED_CONTAM: hypothetical protein Scaly_0078200 [Sesamum calycinum]|uniref:Reverse transcriptase domain-containing protein n=1 Tax=Sesamum calycinum TaxID=2727403 RepID=A0AAW2SV33_9LAMI
MGYRTGCGAASKGEIGKHEHPMKVNLEQCDFFVHIRDLPFNMMNLGVATLIGNKIGSFKDIEMNKVGCSWGAALCIQGCDGGQSASVAGTVGSQAQNLRRSMGSAEEETDLVSQRKDQLEVEGEEGCLVHSLVEKPTKPTNNEGLNLISVPLQFMIEGWGSARRGLNLSDHDAVRITLDRVLNLMPTRKKARFHFEAVGSLLQDALMLFESRGRLLTVRTTSSQYMKNESEQDNMLVAYELNHFLTHRTWGRKGHVSVKQDVNKAYDRVEWCFLERVMGRLGFHPHFVALIMKCVTTISFSFLLNGEQFGFLRPECGLRSNVKEEIRNELAEILGVSIVTKYDKYLGLPTAERAVLIKLVLQTIPTYVMSCFQLPESFLSEIKGLMADFFWNCGTETKSHWVAWAKLCKPKNEGELSFRRLKECNIDVLSKQDWHGAMGSGGLLLAILSHKYFPHMSFLSLDAKVANLITINLEWNVDLVRKEFCSMDTKCILGINLQCHEVEDTTLWHFEKQGKFTVESAYFAVVRL